MQLKIFNPHSPSLQHVGAAFTFFLKIKLRHLKHIQNEFEKLSNFYKTKIDSKQFNPSGD